MVFLSCDVCHESLAHDEFRFLLCGHGLCKECSDQISQCAICRHWKTNQEPFPIYLTLAESNPEDNAKDACDELTRVTGESTATTVMNAAHKIRSVMEDVSEHDSIVRELLEAAKNLEERIHPLFLQLEYEKARNLSLEHQLKEMSHKSKANDVELRRVKTQLADTRKDYEAAVSVAEQAKNCVLREREENARMYRRLQKHSPALAQAEADKLKLQDSLKERDKEVLLLKKKLKALAKPLRRLKHEVHDPDDSLVVEDADDHR